MGKLQQRQKRTKQQHKQQKQQRTGAPRVSQKTAPELNPKDADFDIGSFIEAQAIEMDDDVARLMYTDSIPNTLSDNLNLSGKKRKHTAASSNAVGQSGTRATTESSKSTLHSTVSKSEGTGTKDSDDDLSENNEGETMQVTMDSEDERELEIYMEMMQHQKPEPSVQDDEPLIEKVYANKKEAILSRLADIEPDLRLTWHERQTLTSTAATSDSVPDINNDLDRELAFYTQSLEAAKTARDICKKSKVPFTRPSDYFAEMVKSDQHMHRVRQRLVEEAEGIKASERAKKQRDLKKFGKKVQHEKVMERESAKKDALEKIKIARRKGISLSVGDDDNQSGGVSAGRNSGGRNGRTGTDAGADDEFGIEIDRPKKQGPASRGGANKGKPTNREYKNTKFGFGGPKRNSKRNTPESLDNFGGSALKRMKSGTKHGGASGGVTKKHGQKQKFRAGGKKR
ncbi:hypothetical protein BASA61_002623 [Batrachochytrium salamandrivorans]|nr:hypothetical protein BASA62_007512 [Batrachochytrium salamandrivorans]KAH6599283.1 hypothetical protein BASA61_002623 [Batrachochytrium salamandrivorans]